MSHCPGESGLGPSTRQDSAESTGRKRISSGVGYDYVDGEEKEDVSKACKLEYVDTFQF